MKKYKLKIPYIHAERLLSSTGQLPKDVYKCEERFYVYIPEKFKNIQIYHGQWVIYDNQLTPIAVVSATEFQVMVEGE